MLSWSRTMLGCCNFLHIRASRSNFWKSVRFFCFTTSFCHYEYAPKSFDRKMRTHERTHTNKKADSLNILIWKNELYERKTIAISYVYFIHKEKHCIDPTERPHDWHGHSVQNDMFCVGSIQSFFSFVCLFVCIIAPNQPTQNVR